MANILNRNTSTTLELTKETHVDYNISKQFSHFTDLLVKKIGLLQCYEKLWMHFIDASCAV